MICELYPLNERKTYKYVVVLSLYEERLLLSRHRQRATWETQGGHIEAGETPEMAAKRELYEESGVREAELCPLFDYWAKDDRGNSNGQVFLARVREQGPLPQSEMAETRLFDALPENLTYPDLTPIFWKAAREQGFLQALSMGVEA